MVKKQYMGKTVKEHFGYKIKHMIQFRMSRGPKGKEISHQEPSGYFGVYAGKNLLCGNKEFKKVKDAEQFLFNYIKNKKYEI